MRTMRRLNNNVFPDTTGIFREMAAIAETHSEQTPWGKLGISSEVADIEYLYNHSGKKYVAPIIDSMLTDDEEPLSIANVQKLARIVYEINKHKWGKLVNTLFFEYNPIENYRMTEEGVDETTRTHGEIIETSDESSNTKSGSLTFEKRDDVLSYGAETLTMSGIERETYDDVTDTESYSEDGGGEVAYKEKESFSNYNETHKIAGFNSASFQNDTQITKDGTRSVATEGKKFNTKSGNVDRSFVDREDERRKGDDTIQHGRETTTYDDILDEKESSAREEHSGTTEDVVEHELTRSGNIGVTTSQQMIESERLLYMWDMLREVIYKDVDNVVALNIY